MQFGRWKLEAGSWKPEVGSRSLPGRIRSAVVPERTSWVREGDDERHFCLI